MGAWGDCELGTISCPPQEVTLPSGTYALPLLVSGDQTLPCNSGYEGSLTFSCNADFTWSLPEDTCGGHCLLPSRRARRLSRRHHRRHPRRVRHLRRNHRGALPRGKT